MPWQTQGRLTNPNAGAVVADTGPLPSGTSYSPQLVVSSTTTAQVLLQRRDAANAQTLTEQLIVCPANNTINISVTGYLNELQDNERIRLVLNANMTGSIQGSLFW